MTQKDHDGKDENGIPSHEEDDVYTYQDPNFYDYTRLSDFTDKTGIEALLDNAADFLEVYYRGGGRSTTITVYIATSKIKNERTTTTLL